MKSQAIHEFLVFHHLWDGIIVSKATVELLTMRTANISQSKCSCIALCKLIFKSQNTAFKKSPSLFLIIFHPSTSHSRPSHPMCLFSHSLSGRDTCEGPVQHNSAPTEASSSCGYNSEWISISSGRVIRMRNCVPG